MWQKKHVSTEDCSANLTQEGQSHDLNPELQNCEASYHDAQAKAVTGKIMDFINLSIISFVIQLNVS